MTQDAEPAGEREATDGGTPEGEPASFFRAGIEESRQALGEFRRGVEATGLGDYAAARAVVALTLGVGLAYVYEFFVAAAAQLAGTSPAELYDVLSIQLTTTDLLLALLLLVYLDLFVSFVALKRPAGARTDPEGTRVEEGTTGGGLSRRWWAVNLLAGCAAGYLVFVSYGTFAAGLGAGAGLFLGDELYRRARAGGI